MTPCHAEKYAEALRGMAQLMPRMMQAWGSDVAEQPWMRAAMEQHAHYYAAQACGEQPMRMSNYGTMAALGITRVGDNNGVVRNISMAGYGGFGAVHYSPNYQRTCTAGETGTNTPWQDYCNCMFGQGTADAQTCMDSGSGWRGQDPWSCAARLRMLEAGLNSFIDPAEIDACKKDGSSVTDALKSGWSSRKEIASGVKEAVATGKEAATTVRAAGVTIPAIPGITQPTTSATAASSGMTSTLSRDALATLARTRQQTQAAQQALTTMAAQERKLSQPATKSNTMLYVGIGAAALVGAFFFLGKK